MKTALTAIVTALVLGVLFFAFGHPLGVVDYAIILFTASIITWTFEQYKRQTLH